jgi:hypothetical protein
MRVSLRQQAKEFMDVKVCVARLLVKHRVVVKKKVLDGHSQWFSHVR